MAKGRGEPSLFRECLTAFWWDVETLAQRFLPATGDKSWRVFDLRAMHDTYNAFRLASMFDVVSSDYRVGLSDVRWLS